MEYTNSKIKSLIDEYIHSERDRAILYRRMVDGVKFEQLAEEFGMSDRQIKSIVHKHTATILKNCEPPG